MTITAAAERLGVDRSTVTRMIERGRLTRYSPLAGRYEFRPAIMLWKVEVDALAVARALVRGGA